MSAVDNDAWHRTETADAQERGHTSARYDGESRSGGTHVAQDLVDAWQRTPVAGV
jgi:hypothetical protein